MPRDRANPGDALVRTYRQASGLVAAGVVLVVVVGFTLVYLISDRGAGVVPLLWCGAAGCLAVALLVLPCVQVSANGVRVRNIVREFDLTWPAIDLVESRWALTLVTLEDRAVTSFAIATQRPTRARGEAGPAAGLGRVLGSPGAKTTPEHLTEVRGSSAQRVRRVIEDGAQEVADAVAAGELPAQEPTLTVRPSVPGVIALVAAAVCVVLALVL